MNAKTLHIPKNVSYLLCGSQRNTKQHHTTIVSVPVQDYLIQFFCCSKSTRPGKNDFFLNKFSGFKNSFYEKITEKNSNIVDMFGMSRFSLIPLCVFMCQKFMRGKMENQSSVFVWSFSLVSSSTTSCCRRFMVLSWIVYLYIVYFFLDLGGLHEVYYYFIFSSFTFFLYWSSRLHGSVTFVAPGFINLWFGEDKL